MHMYSALGLCTILKDLEQVLGPDNLVNSPLDSRSVVDSSRVDSALAMTRIQVLNYYCTLRLLQYYFGCHNIPVCYSFYYADVITSDPR